MNPVDAYMIFHPIRTRALFTADLIALAVCVAVAIWAHVTDTEEA